MIRRLFIALVCVSLLRSNLTAEEAPRVYTWEEAVNTAFDKNPDLKAAMESVGASRSRVKGSFNEVFPRIDLTNSYTTSRGDSSASNRWLARGSASMNIFNMGSYAEMSSSRYSLDQAHALLRTVSSDVLVALRRSFVNLFYTQQLIEVSKTVLEIRKKNANLLSLRYDSGRESKGNRLRGQADLIQAEVDLNQSLRDLKVAQQEFKRQLGEETSSQLAAAGDFSPTSPIESSSHLDHLVDGHPDVLLRNAQLNVAKANLRSARSTYWPNLTANYSRTFQGKEYFPDEPSWNASGVLSLPIFGSGLTSTYYASQAARQEREAAEQDLISMRNQVRSSLETSLSNFEGAVDQVRVQKAFLEASRQRNEEADVRYSNGLMSYDDWERIVTDRVGFERSVIRAERDAVTAEADWNNSKGIGLGEIQ